MTAPFCKKRIMVSTTQAIPEKPICMTPECGQPVHCRGVCARCLSRMSYSVKKGLTTWRKLVSAGMVLKSEGRGRKNTTLRELNRRKAESN